MNRQQVLEGISSDSQASVMKASNDAFNSMLNLAGATSTVSDTDISAMQYEVLDQYTYGFSEGVENAAKRGFADLSSAVGDLASTDLINEAAFIRKIPKEVAAAYNIVQDPNADFIDKAMAREILSNRANTAGIKEAGMRSGIVTGETYQGKSWGEAIDGMLTSAKKAKARKEWFDIPQKWVKTADTDKLDADLNAPAEALEESWKNDDVLGVVENVGGLLKAAANNKQAIAEHLVGSLASSLLMGTDSPAYAENIFNEALAEYSEKNNGKLPTQEAMKEMYAWSMSGGVADLVGDKLLLGKVTSKGVKQSIKGRLLDIAGGASAEAVTEGYQTAVEENLSKLEDVDVSEVAKGATIGFAVGTAADLTSSPVQDAKTVVKAPFKAVGALRGKVSKEAIDEAVESNDPAQVKEVVASAKTPQESVAVARDIVKKDVPIETKQAVSDELQVALNAKRKEVADIEAEMEEASASGDFDKVLTLSDKFNDASNELDVLSQKSKAVFKAAALEAKQIDEEIANVSNENPDAAKRIFGSFRANPDSISSEQLETLSNNDAIPEAERKIYASVNKVRKIIADAGEVSKQVLEGGYSEDYKRNMTGLKMYVEQIVNGDTTALNNLERFANQHAQKAQRYGAALKESKETGKQVNFADGSWVRASVPSSVKIVKQMAQEAKMLQQAVNEFKSSAPSEATVEPVSPDAVVSETSPSAEVEPSSTPIEEVTSTPEPVDTAPTPKQVKGKTTTYTVTGDSVVDNKTGKEITNPRVKEDVLALAEIQPELDLEPVQENTSQEEVDYGIDEEAEPTVVEQVQQRDEEVAAYNMTQASIMFDASTGGRREYLKYLRKALNTSGAISNNLEKMLFDKMVSRLPKTFNVRAVMPGDKGYLRSVKDMFYKGFTGAATGNTIYLNRASWDGNPNLVYHELDHLANVTSIENAYYNDAKEYRMLEQIWKHIESKYDDLAEGPDKFEVAYFLGKNETGHETFIDGRVNPYFINEMVTIARSTPGVKQWLQSQPGITSTDKSLFNSLVRALKSLFNYDANQMNAWLELVALTEVIVSNGSLEVDQTPEPNTVVHIPTEEVNQPAIEQIKDYRLTDELLKDNNTDLPLNEQNLVSAWLEQSANPKGALETTNNYAQRMVEDAQALLDETYDGEVTPEVLATAKAFMEFHDKFVENLDKIYLTRNDKFLETDFSQYITGPDGKLPANIKTMMAVSAYDWIQSSAMDSTRATEESMRAIFGLKDTDFFDFRAIKLIGLGKTQASIINSLATGTRSMLNLNVKNEGNVDAARKLQQALGTWTFYTMKEAGYLGDTRTVATENIKQFYDEDSMPESIKAMGTHIALVSATNFKPVLDGNTVGSFTAKAFGATSERPAPSFEPPKATGVITKSNQKPTRKQRRILGKDQAKPARLTNTTIGAFYEMNEDLRKAMLGFVTDVKENIIDAMVPSVEAKNRSIENSLEALDKWKNEVEAQPEGINTLFYYTHTVWKNGRMGIANYFNPQSDKVVRYFQHKVEWETKATFGTRDEDWFLLAAGEGFDIVADKQFDADALAEVNQKLQDPVIRAGIAAMKEFIKPQGDKSNETQRTIATAVRAGKMGAKTFQTLVALAHYENAKDKGDATFDHSLAREVDGITNGVFITTLQFAGANMTKLFQKLNRMGVFKKGDMFDDFAAFAKISTNLDSYKTLAKTWGEKLKDNPNRELVSALEGLVGELVSESGDVTPEGRLLAKYPLMTFIYGASVNTILGNIAKGTVDSIYSKVQKAYESGEVKDVANTISALESLAVVLGTKLSKPYSDVRHLKTFSLTTREIKELNRKINQVYADSLKETLEAEYGDVLKARDSFTAAVNVAHKAYAIAYNNRIKAILDSRQQKGNKITDGLTKEELKQLNQEMKPYYTVLNSAITTMTRGNKEDAAEVMEKSGLVFGGSELVPNTYTKMVKGEEVTELSKSSLVEITLAKGSKSKKGSSHHMVEGLSSPGSSAIPMLTQSIDAATQLLLMLYVDGLNVHDAEYLGYKDYDTKTKIYNKVHLDIHKKFSMGVEFYRMTNRVITNAMADPKVWGELSKSYELKKFNSVMIGEKAAIDLKKALSRLNTLANNYDKHKAEAIKLMSVVSQYRNGDGSALIIDRESGIDLDTQTTLAMKETIKEVRDNDAPTPSPNGALFSSAYDKEFEDIDFEPALEINKLNTLETFDFLENSSTNKDSAEHTQRLRNTVSNAVNKVIRPFNLYIGTSEDTLTKGVTSGEDMWIVNRIYDNNSTSKMLAAKGMMSATEVFVHEMVHNITAEALTNNQVLRGQVTKLWKKAKEVIKPEDLLPEGIDDTDATYADELAIAKDKYDHMFTPTEGRSPHLHEFVAMAVTNEKVRDLLENIAYTDMSIKFNRRNTLAQHMEWVWDNILNFVNGFINGTRKGNAKQQMDGLFLALANVDSNAKAKMRTVFNAATAPISIANRIVVKGTAPLREGIEAGIGKPLREASMVTLNGLYKGYREKVLTSDTLYGKAVTNLIEEGSGRTLFNGKMHDIRRKGQKVIDQAREAVTVSTSNVMSAKFSRELSKKEEQALTFGIGKTDATVIKESLGVEGLKLVFSNTTYLNNQIAKLKSELAKFEDRGFLITQAENLGIMMVTGNSYLSNGLRNAKAISIRASHTNNRNQSAEIEPLVDLLASLYAVKNLRAEDRANVNNLMNNEFNGVSFALDVLKDFRTKSQAEFTSNPLNLIKGYMKDNVDPDVSVQVGTKADRATLEKQGYVMKEKLPKDVSDTNTDDMYIFVNPYGNHARYLRGNFYLNTKARKGTTVANFYDMLDSKMVISGSEYNGTVNTKATSNAVPVLDTKGKVIGYQYIMSEPARDNYLSREPAFFSSVGTMMGDIVTKSAIPDHNVKVVGALKEQFDNDYQGNEEQYTFLKPTAVNEKVREQYAMLPKEVRDAARAIWGDEGIPIRNDMFNLIIGYRKVRLADSFFKDPEARNVLEQVAVPLLTKVLGSEKAAKRVFIAQDAIEELVKLTKDIIVIKSGIVTLTNTMSNITQLWLSGVPLSFIGKNYVNSYAALRNHRRSTNRLLQVDQELLDTSLSTRQRAKLMENKRILESELMENPINDLIEEGVMPNIVEDISAKPDDFSISSSIAKRVDASKAYNKVVSKVPAPVKTVAREAFIMQGSEMYQLLNGLAQFSDFGARAVRYKYLVENGTDKQEAVGRVMDEFINYDLPTGRYMQFLNDIGIFWFSKYLIRVQRTIARMVSENPGRTLALLMGQGITGFEVPSTLGSFVDNPLTRMGDPITSAFSAAGDLSPIGVLL